jgi:hypothetical protein
MKRKNITLAYKLLPLLEMIKSGDDEQNIDTHIKVV